MIEKGRKPKRRKVPIWLPYTSSIKSSPKGVVFEYKGGTCDSRWQELHSIMFYGDVCPLDSKFLDYCRRYQIPICIHRRNVRRAVWITPSTETNAEGIIYLKTHRHGVPMA